MSERQFYELQISYEDLLERHEALQRRFEFVERRLDAVAKFGVNTVTGGRAFAIESVTVAVRQAMAAMDRGVAAEARKRMLSFEWPEDYYDLCAYQLLKNEQPANEAIDAIRDACLKFALTWDEIGVTHDAGER